MMSPAMRCAQLAARVNVGVRHRPARMRLESKRFGDPARAEIADQRISTVVLCAKPRNSRAYPQNGARPGIRRAPKARRPDCAAGPVCASQFFGQFDDALAMLPATPSAWAIFIEDLSAAARPPPRPLRQHGGRMKAAATAFGTTTLRRRSTSTPVRPRTRRAVICRFAHAAGRRTTTAGMHRPAGRHRNPRHARRAIDQRRRPLSQRAGRSRCAAHHRRSRQRRPP